MQNKEEIYNKYRLGQITKDELIDKITTIDFPQPSLGKKILCILSLVLFPFFTDNNH